MNQLISRFAVKGQPAQYSRYGCGHINETYMVTCDSGFVYILQKINKFVFKDPVAMVENANSVASFLLNKTGNPKASATKFSLCCLSPVIRTWDSTSVSMDVWV